MRYKLLGGVAIVIAVVSIAAGSPWLTLALVGFAYISWKAGDWE